MSTTFEEVLPGYTISGGIHLHEGTSTEGFPTPGTPVINKIVQTDQPLMIHFLWKVTGPLNLVLNPGCNYVCRVYCEKMGPGADPVIPSQSTGIVVANMHQYNEVLNIQPNTIPEGAYKIVCSLTLRGPAPSFTPLPVAAFVDLGVIEFYKA